jgi:hypothetical protein
MWKLWPILAKTCHCRAFGVRPTGKNVTDRITTSLCSKRSRSFINSSCLLKNPELAGDNRKIARRLACPPQNLSKIWLQKPADHIKPPPLSLFFLAAAASEQTPW